MRSKHYNTFRQAILFWLSDPYYSHSSCSYSSINHQRTLPALLTLVQFKNYCNHLHGTLFCFILNVIDSNQLHANLYCDGNHLLFSLARPWTQLTTWIVFERLSFNVSPEKMFDWLIGMLKTNWNRREHLLILRRLLVTDKSNNECLLAEVTNAFKTFCKNSSAACIFIACFVFSYFHLWQGAEES